MNRNGIVLICVSLLLSSCATDFSAHLESSIKDGEVSELGLASKFVIVNTDKSSQKVNYSYGYLFGVLATSAIENYALSRSGLFKSPQTDYAEYTKNKEYVIDSKTKELITKRLENIGMTKAGEDQDKDILLLSYEELMGWDMGEIVKKMRICGRIASLPGSFMDCAEFSEMKLANSHPTRELVVNNLISILLTKKWPKAASVDKYKKIQAGK